MSYRQLRHGEDDEGTELDFPGEMHGEDVRGSHSNVEEDANICSKATFWYQNPMFKLGYQRPLEEEDIGPLAHQDTSETVSQKFEQAWQQETQKEPERISLPLAFNRAFGFSFWIAALWKLVNDVIQFVQPMMISYLTKFVADDSQTIWQGLGYCLILLIAPTIQSVAIHQYFHQCFRTGMHLRTACTTFVYRKAIRLSNEGKASTTQGEIVNLMSTDSRRLLDLTSYLQTLWSAPLQVIISMVLLYNFMGPASLAGLAAMLVMIPLNALIARFQAKFQTELMTIKDERVRMMSEYLNGMRVIKFFSWETSFAAKIEEIRSRELSVLRKSQLLSVLGSFLWTMTPIFVSVSSFATFVALGNTLSNEIIFPSIAIFNILRFPISMFPRVISSVVSAKVSFDRLKSFLLQPDLQSLDDPRYERSDELPVYSKMPAISFENASFRWQPPTTDAKDSPIILSDITLDVQPGQLVVIVGSVGSGKSSLLSALLGDMHLETGRVSLHGKVAYVPQTAWMKNETITGNITFGEPFDEHKFDETVRVCALAPDLDILPGGAQCEIGEKGINLSGGQKQRISIARAVYSDADIFLFDDPLSAVDIHVGTHIYEQCILNHLKGKTRFLVTHQLYTLSRADLIIFMEGGKIAEMGSYEQLIEDQAGFAALIRDHHFEHLSSSAAKKDDEEEEEEGEGGDGQKPEGKKEEGKDKKKDGPRSELIAAEERDTGSVKIEVYKTYASNVGIILMVLILTFPAVTQSLTIYSNYWLSYWSQNTEHDKDSWYMMVFLVLSLSGGVSTFLSATSLAFGSLRAARIIHSSTLKRVFRATLSFFETTPVGRILNRFSKDQDCIDNSLPGTMQSLIACLSSVVGVVVLVLVASPFFLIALVPLTVAYYYTSKYYLETSRELKRLDSNTNSPIYAHFSETLNGVTTIRAYRATDRFIAENEERLDRNLRLYFPMVTSNRWLAIRLETISTLVSVFVGLAAVFTRHWVDSGLIGLALTYCLGITGALSWLVRMATDTETQMNAVERMVQYQTIPQEAALETPTDPPTSWPTKGKVVFDNVVMRYRPDLPPALRGVSAEIQPLEKIGIVGRTGSGKSSLVATLFRLIELQSGAIYLDDVDIAEIGLSTLRRSIAIIPQDPVLFEGSIRANLDPFDEYDDREIWAALARVDLTRVVEALPDGLAAKVSEDGGNFSLGQKQLFCLARALLRQAKVLVLDEATSAVDVETDHLIQKTIRSNLPSTIITVAHRLNTIIDYDRIMVLDQGHLVEFDSPAALLARPGSVFASMVGNNQHLIDMANRGEAPQSGSSHLDFDSE